MMTNSLVQLISSVLVFSLLLTLLLLVRKLPSTRQKRLTDRLREATELRNFVNDKEVDGDDDELTDGHTLRQKIAQRLIAIGDMIPLLDAKQRSALGMQLTRAGFRERKAVSVLVGIKLVVGAVASFAIAVSASSIPFVNEHFLMRVVAMGAAFIVGIIFPETLLGMLIKRRQKKIAAYLPDALDLLVICTNAGNSLPISIKRVAREMQLICPPISAEFKVTADQLQIDGDTGAALRDMATRIGIASMSSLVTTLIQSQQYGTPISQSLKTLSRSERNAQMMVMEEKASKLAAKMTIPMMLCILPTVGIIAVGPAVLRLMQMFANQ
ncbi:type II secretion system F family protein [Burkholderia sp. L27(2015)]|uniref:type II secretion system F family protein n=1 Tax=Burkholderia sp. L27(2015) TaxID=1641858 RepID=UPI00131C36D2|nr:type II secretion system F family protein [Burkholderia sp. L27(2015)]